MSETIAPMGKAWHALRDASIARPAEEYAAGHVPGARSIPIEELERRLEELPADHEVVAYCRGPLEWQPAEKSSNKRRRAA